MFGTFFYNETIKRSISVFGTLFNNIHTSKIKADGTVLSKNLVPISYGPKQKFLARLDQDADLTSKVAITLPRIGFEIQNMAYDTTRKLNRVQKFKKSKSGSTSQLETQFMPVPYNLDFELFIMAKQSDDALQIIEQILPFFQPEYTITVNDNLDMKQKRDVPILLPGIDYEDNYEGDFTTRRAIIYTLSFTAKFYLYGPVTSQSVIKSVQVDQFTDLPDKSPKREQR